MSTLRPGVFRRGIAIRTSPGIARADVEDDAHRYGALIRHDGVRVEAVEGFALRTPWSACAGAVPALQRLLGMPLSPSPAAVYEHTASSEQCTHLFDVAGLAIAHAARGIARRRYEVDVPVVDRTSPRQATLRRDGVEALCWTVQGRSELIGPPPFVGLDIRTILEWARREGLDADAFEAIVVLRRAWLVSGCRNFQLDDLPTATAGTVRLGACHVYRAGVVETARRNIGTTLDFTATPERLLGDLQD
jgi:hypothetical protein